MTNPMASNQAAAAAAALEADEPAALPVWVQVEMPSIFVFQGGERGLHIDGVGTETGREERGRQAGGQAEFGVGGRRRPLLLLVVMVTLMP